MACSTGGDSARDGAGDRSEEADSSTQPWGWKLRFKGTFIDVLFSQEGSREGSLSPRPSSEPGSVTCGSASYFDRQEQYISDLSGQLSQNWRTHTCGGVSYGTRTDIQDQDDSTVCDLGSLCDQIPATELANIPTRPSRPSEYEADQADLGQDTETASPLDREGAPVKSLKGMMPRMPTTGITKHGRWDRKELHCHIKYATREVEKSLQQNRRLTMLSAIQEIPEQVGDALQKSAISIVDDVIGEVAVVRDIIQGDTLEEQTCIDRAVAKLEVIPEMIQDSFETYFARAERTVRRRVDDMIQGLEDTDLASEQVVKKMWTIPSEVQEIAKEAMQAAVAESRMQAQQQIDCALAALPSSDSRWLAGVAEGRIVGQVPVNSSHMVQPAKDVAADTVELAVAVAKEGGEELPKVANQVVAETLLRAKVGSSERADGGNSPSFLQEVSVNEGSIGHPELCARPCLYFAKGECTNGQGCNFCHLEHPRRPVHPDKKNRQLLKTMPFAECVVVLAPILRRKVEELGLGSAAMRMLDEFTYQLAGESFDDAAPALAGRRRKQLQEFLRSMTLRSVMSLLMRAAPNEFHRQAVENLTARLRMESNGASRPGLALLQHGVDSGDGILQL